MNNLTARIRDQKNDHIAQVVQFALSHLDPLIAGEVASFVRSFSATLSPGEILAWDKSDLFATAVSLWQFSARRGPGEANIRVFNPSPEEGGRAGGGTIIEIVHEDMPFLVDSVLSALSQMGHDIRLLNHPVMTVIRNSDGDRTAVLEHKQSLRKGGDTSEGAIAESVMHIEIDPLGNDAEIRETQDRLVTILENVRATVEDWRPMIGHLEATIATLKANPPNISREELSEVIDFLTWLGDNHFTFIGYREYTYKAGKKGARLEQIGDSGLGVLRADDVHVLGGRSGKSPFSAEVREFLQQPHPIIVTKANMRSTVHRPVHLDYIGVKKFDSSGKLLGEHRFVGLFTSVAYNRSTLDIPFLRRKVSRVLERSGFLPSSHDQKALVNILENFPRDELFQTSDDDLFDTTLGILRLQEKPAPKAFVRADQYERFVSVLVFIPREIHDTGLRVRIGEMLARTFAGRISAQYTQLGDDALARLHFIISTTPGEVPEVDTDELDERLRATARTWREGLGESLACRCNAEKARKLLARYGDSFSTAYVEYFSPELAVEDIEKLEALADDEAVDFKIYRRDDDPADSLRLKIYHASRVIPLSDCLPKLEHMGLKVIEEYAYDIHRPDDPNTAWIHDFLMKEPHGDALDYTEVRPRLEEALAKVWSGIIEDDGFNALVLRVGLDWRRASTLRAYARYLRQINSTFSQAYMERSLISNPGIARDLVSLFHLRLDPRQGGSRKNGDKKCKAVVASIEAALEKVTSLDEDRILRQFLNLITATLRTNYFQRTKDGTTKPSIAFKLDSEIIEGLPLPRPHAEIWVYSPRLEGVHLRGGKVARGGLRWSDRREDFRTEVLGLMKAQMVKNAVIVPVGAKGGFVPKHLPTSGGRDAFMAEGIACYKIFVSGLLDVTDNLDGEAVLPPPDVIRYDDDDPYLVVAADKGTATFSDIANGISAAYGFWLDDAFASGGSAGYDHKKMAITARGAWVSVQRHFRELGVDVQKEPISVVGIGDMSGDVFGNGMLRSRCIRLIAAFDHRNIFIDPDPDPTPAFDERQRLFDLPRSSWADYDEKLISKGGGIFDRQAKSIALSPEIRKMIGIEDKALAPLALIRHLLRLEADLLWVGGIGTYVKAHEESNVDVGDRANDGLRIDGRDLRVKVVGEGGNLGFTQRGRIEYAAAGGRLNTDAIDNSAGVDCSDHEVNIKILLNTVIADGDLARADRDALLVEMTDEVAAHVLIDNYRQTEAISVSESRGVQLLDAHSRLMRRLERIGLLDRDIEYLPGDEELDSLQSAGRGLRRPEIAVLVSYAKMALFQQILDSDVPEDGYLKRDLFAAFPKELVSRYPEGISRHRLRRDIIATALANSVINWGGPSFIDRIEEDTGMESALIVRALVVTREVFELPALWAQTEALDNQVPAAVQTQLLQEIIAISYRQTIWFLNNLPHPIDMESAVNAFAPGIKALTLGPESLLSEFEATNLREKRQSLIDKGIPYELAHNVASLEPLESATDICLVANTTERTVEDVAEAYYELGSYLGLNWLRTTAEEIKTDEHWSARAVAYLVDDLFGQQRALTNQVLDLGADIPVAAALKNWVGDHAAAVERSQVMIRDIRNSGPMTVAKLAYANRHVRGLLHNGTAD